MSAADDPRPERDRLLFDAALGEGLCRATARARLEGEPSGARELREFEEHLARTHRELHELPEWSRQREQALVTRILAQTTRAAPLRRRPSVLVRALPYAAAVLVAGLSLLVFARAAGTTAVITTAPSTPKTTAEVRVADLRPEGGVQEVLTLAHEQLASTAAAARDHRLGSQLDSDAPLEARLLEARAKGLRERRWEPWLEEIPLADLGTLSLALWFEVELDRYVLSGERPPAWKKAVDILKRDLASARAGRENERLLAHALERAGDYGLTDGGTPVRVAQADALWTGEWFSDLESAGREAGLSESGVWRAWIDWRGR
jgi:hypothetical protein